MPSMSERMLYAQVQVDLCDLRRVLAVKMSEVASGPGVGCDCDVSWRLCVACSGVFLPIVMYVFVPVKAHSAALLCEVIVLLAIALV